MPRSRRQDSGLLIEGGRARSLGEEWGFGRVGQSRRVFFHLVTHGGWGGCISYPQISHARSYRQGSDPDQQQENGQHPP
jgi:hypothetical protein